MIKDYCVPVAINANVLNRDKDGDEGKFYRTHFARLENKTFLATASGKRLDRGMRDWLQLPAAERKPGGVKVEELSRGKKADPDPPPGGLIAKVYLRTFLRDGKKRLEYEKLMPLGGGRYESEPGRDHLWLTRDEWRSLVPKDPKVGDTFPVPAAVRDRIIRYHLLLAPDRVVGRGWAPDQVREASLQLTVEEVGAASVQLRLDGSAQLANPAGVDLDKTLSGCEARLYGRLIFDKKNDAFSRFDIMAFGHFWDRKNDWRQGKPETGWLGIAFELVDPAKVGENILLAPPYLLMREENDYFGTRR